MAEALDKLKEEVVVAEAMLTGVFWNNPDNYNFYSKEKINRGTFLNKVYGFFYGLGSYMHEKNISVFDDITTMKFIKELGLEKPFEKYGGYETIQEIMEEAKGKEDNLDGYYEEIKKYALLKSLTQLFGKKVLEKQGNYDYHNMTKEVLHAYWDDKVNQLGMDGDNKYDEYHLLDGLEEWLEEINDNPDVGLPFFQSKLLNEISNGWTQSDVFMFGAFSNAGKTSFAFNKVVMSCIQNKEKLVVIANEEGLNSFREKLMVTSMGVGTKNAIPRKKFKQGEFTDEEKVKTKKALDWLKETTNENKDLITFVYMEDYIMSDVQKLIRHYHNRGYQNFIIDTHKVSSHSEHKQRWEIFIEDMKTIHKLTRKEGGGLNLRMFVNFQLADRAILNRFLDYDAIGEGKAAKNEAGLVWMMRGIWADEIAGGKNEILGFRFKPNIEGDGYQREEFKITKEQTVFLVFTPKNRNGTNNECGLPVLLYEVDFNRNSWKELGWCFVNNDKGR